MTARATSTASAAPFKLPTPRNVVASTRSSVVFRGLPPRCSERSPKPIFNSVARCTLHLQWTRTTAERIPSRYYSDLSSRKPPNTAISQTRITRLHELAIQFRVWPIRTNLLSSGLWVLKCSADIGGLSLATANGGLHGQGWLGRSEQLQTRYAELLNDMYTQTLNAVNNHTTDWQVLSTETCGKA
ncbi:hypothetical protein C8F01DRAFT_1092586 [Mycena amicta]|nr:hypothetical protein C8F01DRAFT_1092586 [Mycena amicta]